MLLETDNHCTRCTTAGTKRITPSESSSAMPAEHWLKPLHVALRPKMMSVLRGARPMAKARHFFPFTLTFSSFYVPDPHCEILGMYLDIRDRLATCMYGSSINADRWCIVSPAPSAVVDHSHGKEDNS